MSANSTNGKVAFCEYRRHWIDVTTSTSSTQTPQGSQGCSCCSGTFTSSYLPYFSLPPPLRKRIFNHRKGVVLYKWFMMTREEDHTSRQNKTSTNLHSQGPSVHTPSCGYRRHYYPPHPHNRRRNTCRWSSLR